MIKIIYTKIGEVPIDNQTGEDVWNFTNPRGFPTQLIVDFIGSSMGLNVSISDDSNGPVSKNYKIELDEPATEHLLIFFQSHIARLFKAKYPEFNGLDFEIIIE